MNTCKGSPNQNVMRTRLQPTKDAVKFAERDALPPIFEAEDRRRWEAGLAGELDIRYLPALLAEENRELTVQRLLHPVSMAEPLFRMRNLYALCHCPAGAHQ